MIILSFIVFIVLILFSISYSNAELFTNKQSKQKNCFIVISKEVTENMYKAYSETIKDNLIFISDKKPMLNNDNIIHYDTQLLIDNGFTNMHSSIKVTSWDKVLFHISKSNLFKKYEYIWIVEDDCYLNKNHFNEFIQNYNDNTEDLIIFGWYKTIKEKWNLWNLNKISKDNTLFQHKNLRASNNQICRLSPKFVEEVLKLREKYNTFRCHELLFASIVQEKKLKILKENNPKVKISALINPYSKKTIKRLEEENVIIVHPKKNWYNV